MKFASSFDNWLSGVRVLDFTAVLAGPHLARSLAQAGAEVVKIESIPTGDTTRGLPYRYDGGQSGYFKQQNLGKLSFALDLASPGGHRIALELAAKSEVVVENFRPGVVERLGIGYEDLRKVRPDLVYVSISGWGQTGPYSRMTGEVRSTTALSGLMAPDRDGHAPAWERCSFGDTNASIHGLAAIGAALFRARSRGEGTYVDFSILEGLIATNCLELPEVLCAAGGLDGREYRSGPDYARVASGFFQADGGDWLYVRALEPSAWRRLATLLDLDHLGDLGVAERRPEAEAIYARLSAYCARQPLKDLLATFAAANVSAVPLRSIRDALADPATARAGLVQDVPDAFAGSVTVPTGLFASTAFGHAAQRPEPLLGQHSRHVLTHVLGYSAAEVDRLVAEGIVQEHALAAGVR